MIELLQRIGHLPRQCVWELTLRCNLRCAHCGSFAGACRDDELDLDTCRRVADELAALGCLHVTLGGGEPTLHPHWEEIAARLTRQGVRVNVLTNGWAWSSEHVAKAKSAGLTNVCFSLDGLEPAHDAVRREGSFARVIAAMRLCAAAKLPLGVVTHINRLNQGTLGALRALLGDVGVEQWQIQLGVPTGHMSEHPELVIDPADVLDVVPQIAALRRQQDTWPVVSPSHNIGYYGTCEPALRHQDMPGDVWLGCRAGCQVLGIESNGNVKGCLSLPSQRHGRAEYVEGSLRAQSLAEIWHRPGAFAHNRSYDEQRFGGFCAACRYRDICRAGCAWTAVHSTGDRFNNPYCLYRQAVIHERQDLLGDDPPNAAERAAARVERLAQGRPREEAAEQGTPGGRTERSVSDLASQPESPLRRAR